MLHSVVSSRDADGGAASETVEKMGVMSHRTNNRVTLDVRALLGAGQGRVGEHCLEKENARRTRTISVDRPASGFHGGNRPADRQLDMISRSRTRGREEWCGMGAEKTVFTSYAGRLRHV